MAKIGLTHLQFDHHGMCIIRYVRADGVERELSWDIGSLVVSWDWDSDPPSTWVHKANDWLANNKPKLAKHAGFKWWTERTIEDHGPGDVREIYTENWTFAVGGRLDEDDPADEAIQ